MTRLPILSDVAAAAEHCSFCPKMCRFACPVAEATGLESVTPWGIDRVITQMAHGADLSAEELAPIWACTGCRQCGGACVPGLDLPTQVRAARAVAVEKGLAPPATQEAAGSPCAADAALAAGATAGAGLVIYPGCASADGGALAAVLAAAGVTYDVIRGDSCCGARAVDVGQAEVGMERSAALLEQVRAAEKIVVTDPHCARWLRIDLEDERVQTLPEYLVTIVDSLQFKPLPGAVAWHDPCWLGRGMAQYDDARAVVRLAAGGGPLEPEHTRDRAWCAGGGMGYPEADPEGAAEILRRRAEELHATTAPAVVTACPTAAARLGAAGLDAHDLAGYLASRLEGSAS